MSGKPIPEHVLQEALDAYALHGSVAKAARALGIPTTTMQHRVEIARRDNFKPKEPDFEAPFLPSENPSAQELIEFRKKEYQRQASANDARKLIRIKVKIAGPIGIAHMGDPHLDDPGSDMPALERDVEIIKRTDGMLAGNVGDFQNNWIGRLSFLHGQQSITARQSWILTEWLITSTPWLYLVKGNHDCWSGSGDPVDWMIRPGQGPLEAHGARLNLVFPNGKEVRINARHDFVGHSMWNEVHGPKKAAAMGWRDHVLVCGHHHTANYTMEKCPATGLLSHIIRVAGYKRIDSYAKAKGLPNKNIFPSCVTIIDPTQPDDSTRLIQTLFDLEHGADYLTWLRKKAK